eukprot:SM000232S07940  [mRNA]  locus=s232:86833:90691:+ [translate_table: standard]
MAAAASPALPPLPLARHPARPRSAPPLRLLPPRSGRLLPAPTQGLRRSPPRFRCTRLLPAHRARAAASGARLAAEQAGPEAGVAVYKPASCSTRHLSCSCKWRNARGGRIPGASDEFADANFQLALAFASKLHQTKGINCRLILPDMPEKRRALSRFQTALQMTNGLSVGSLDDAATLGKQTGFFASIRNALDFDFSGDIDGIQECPHYSWQSKEPADLFIVLQASTSELPSVQTFVESHAKATPVVLFNLELDTLRSDLGLFGFPAKSIHYCFLSQFLPVFYIRLRDYSKTIPVAPFIINYSGALLRIFPGPWQVMLKQMDGSYACVAESTERYNLSQVKEELLISLGLEEKEGSAMQFLRRGKHGIEAATVRGASHVTAHAGRFKVRQIKCTIDKVKRERTRCIHRTFTTRT